MTRPSDTSSSDISSSSSAESSANDGENDEDDGNDIGQGGDDGNELGDNGDGNEIAGGDGEGDDVGDHNDWAGEVYHIVPPGDSNQQLDFLRDDNGERPHYVRESLKKWAKRGVSFEKVDELLKKLLKML